jgi:spore germination protein YaaH
MRLRGTTALIASAAVAAATLVAAPSASAAEAPRPVVFGWFGWWASDTAIAQLTSNSEGVVDEVAMFWWSFQGEKNPLCLYDNGDYDRKGDWGDCLDSGWATPWTTPKFDRQRKVLQDAGIKVQASITDLGASSKGKLSAYLSTAKNRRAYAKQITDYAVKAGVDGIDLDWEVFAFHDGRESWAVTKPRWVEMIKVLSKELRAKDLSLSVTIPGGQAYWGGTTGVYALKEIIDYADSVRFMTYDYSWSSPGPLSPADWARAQLEAAIAEVGEANAGKLWLGNPQYGREWALNKGTSTAPVYSTDEKCPEGWSPGFYNSSGTWVSTVMRTIATPEAARASADANGAQPEWNATQGEWTYRYSPTVNGRHRDKGSFIEVQCKVEREVWFGDTRSALRAASNLPDLKIGGIAVWNLSNVESDFYPRLADYGREIAPAATSVTVRVPRTTTYGSTISVRVGTDSRAGAAKGAEATLYFAPQGGSATRAKVGSITLDGDGKGVFKVPAAASGTWTVSVAGSWSRAAGESAPVSTTVRYAVTAKASASKVAVGTPVTITGTVSPTSAGTAVKVQRRSASGAWRDVATTTTGADGSVTATVKPTVAGETSYRLLVPASAVIAQGASARLVITVG